ncbi:UNVERIFIED_CONTAM: hypothetical protein GTU68_044750 [Idotea baltica]|nr:hypothetical protein [Idotea baltica]
MQGLMKQAQDMQNKLQSAQAEAKEMTAEGSSGGGAVKVLVNGKYQIETLNIDPSIIDPEDADILQESVLAAVNSALASVAQKMEEKLSKVTGGMNIPGM